MKNKHFSTQDREVEGENLLLKKTSSNWGHSSLQELFFSSKENLVDHYQPTKELSMLGVTYSKIQNTKQISLYHLAHFAPTSHHYSCLKSPSSILSWHLGDISLYLDRVVLHHLCHSALLDWANQSPKENNIYLGTMALSSQ